MIVIRGENLPPRGENQPPLKPNVDFRQKKGGHPKVGKNSTNSDLAQNFRVTSDQQKIMIWGEKPPLPPSRILILGKKRGGAPQIRQKFNQLGFGSKFQDNLRPTKDWD